MSGNAATPVTFGINGLNENIDTNNTGFNSPSGDAASQMSPYTIPPVVWMFVFLIAGYFGVRYFMED